MTVKIILIFFPPWRRAVSRRLIYKEAITSNDWSVSFDRWVSLLDFCNKKVFWNQTRRQVANKPTCFPWIVWWQEPLCRSSKNIQRPLSGKHCQRNAPLAARRTWLQSQKQAHCAPDGCTFELWPRSFITNEALRRKLLLMGENWTEHLTSSLPWA